MSTPSSTLYVHPGWASANSWTYAGTSFVSAGVTTAVTAVAFDVDSSLGQALSRGAMQYSLDHGQTWTSYAAPVDAAGSFMPVAGTLWRFLDQNGNDDTTPNTFSAHYQLANGSVVEVNTTLIMDDSPVGLVGGNDTMFSTMHAGDVVDTLRPIDTGAPTGGRWVIDSQSQPGLFAISYNPATDSAARLVVADPGQLPASGMAASVTVHFYDPYQIDSVGNPIAGQGVSDTLSYTVQDGATSDLSGFSTESRMGAATDAAHAAPALATLSTGGYVAVWQGPDTDTVAGGAGAGLWAQLRDASGNALGTAFALTPNGDATLEGQPAVAALAGGRFVVAYQELDGGVSKIAWRVVEANGTAGSEHVLDAGAAGDAAMPAVTTLSDGSFAVGWRSGGQVHVQQVASATGAPAGGEQVFGALSSAFSPSIAALPGGGYVVSWGEMNDGNVYAASSSNHSPVVVSGDGDAASISTAAPLPHVSALAGGGYVVAWDSYANDPLGFSQSDIFFQVYDNGGHAVGAVTQANVDSGGDRYDAEVAALSDGSFVVTWQGSDFDGNGIFGRRFGLDGSALDGHEFEINQLRAGDQSNAGVTALAKGGFASAWVDTAADGSVGIETRVLPPLADAPGGSAGDSGGGAGTGSTAPADPVTVPATPTTPATPVVPAGPVTPVVPVVPSVPVSTAGGGGSVVMKAPSGTVVLDGVNGLDTVAYSGASSGYAIQKDASGNYSLSDALGGHVTLVNVERLQFGDQTVALDIDGDAGQAYRLYQAAFHRTPDKDGLGFWIEAMDQGHPLQEVANAFVTSQEFTNLYGANTTDAQFVTALYQNVLHRTPDQDGYDFWLQGLQTASRAKVLIDFSESAENRAQVSSSIQNGIAYLPGATPAPSQAGTPVGTPAGNPAGTTSGNAGEVLKAPAGNAIVAGMGGLDTVVFSGNSSAWTIQHDSTGYSVSDALGDHATLMKVERLQFGDQMVALDIDGDAGQAYRLYQAAFHRTPDKDGLGFWIEAMDQGHPLQEVANAFVTSQEFTNLYGANTTDAQFVTALYQNVLHRTPDQDGYDFWMHGLQTASRAQVLIDFSESTENQAQVIGSIQNGIGYLHGG